MVVLVLVVVVSSLPTVLSGLHVDVLVVLISVANRGFHVGFQVGGTTGSLSLLSKLAELVFDSCWSSSGSVSFLISGKTKRSLFLAYGSSCDEVPYLDLG